MIRVGIQIGNGEIEDSYDKYGLIYVSSDNRFAAPTKGMLMESIAEMAGAVTDGKTTDDVFEYKTTFLLKCQNNDHEDANQYIKALNELMYDREPDSDIKIFKEWTIHNPYKKCRITGIPKPIEEPTFFLRDYKGNIHDAVEINLILNVMNPNKCDFSTFSSLK